MTSHLPLPKRLHATLLGMIAGGLLVPSGACNEYQVDPLTPILAVEPREIDFGLVPMLSVGASSLELTNTGEALLVFEMIDAGAPFLSSETSGELEPGESLSVTVRFQADAEGPFSDTLRIASNDPDRPELDIPLKAQVLAPELHVDPASLTYLADGSLQSDRVYLSNDGEGALVVTGLWMADDGDGAFALETAAVDFTLAAGEVRAIDVSCSTDEASVGALQLTTNNLGSPTVGISLSATEVDCPDLWYPDEDGDGYGAPDSPIAACDPPSGHVASGDDCDDTEADVHPGQPEICNGIDDDCDGDEDDTPQALHFTGPADFVEIPFASELHMGEAGAIEAWVFSEVPDNYGMVYNKWANGAEDHQLAVSDGAVYGWVALPSGVDYIHANSSASRLSLEDWHHVAFVWEPGEARVYIDGVLSGVGPSGGAPANASGAAYIGSITRLTEVRTALQGFIADVRLSSAVRYTVDFSPDSSLGLDGDTMALWKLDEGSGSVALESSSANDGTISGARWEAAPCR